MRPFPECASCFSQRSVTMRRARSVRRRAVYHTPCGIPHNKWCTAEESFTQAAPIVKWAPNLPDMAAENCSPCGCMHGQSLGCCRLPLTATFMRNTMQGCKRAAWTHVVTLSHVLHVSALCRCARLCARDARMWGCTHGGHQVVNPQMSPSASFMHVPAKSMPRAIINRSAQRQSSPQAEKVAPKAVLAEGVAIGADAA